MKSFFSILVLIFLTSNVLISQTWNYKSGGNAFDGKYKTASIIGKGTSYPYNKPLLVVNVFNDESLNFYITNAGYFQSIDDVEILWIFSNDPNTQYKSYFTSISEDSKILFLDEFLNMETYTFLKSTEFIGKIKSASKVSVRIKNKYGKNDVTFSLRGSTKALNYVISKKYLKKISDQQKALDEYYEALTELKELKFKQDSIIDTNILSIIKDYGVNIDDEASSLLVKIKSEFELNDLSIKDIDSISIKTDRYSSSFYAYDNNKNLIRKITYIRSLIPKYINEKKEEEIKKAKIKRKKDEIIIERIISIYDFDSYEKNKVIKTILDMSYILEYDIAKIAKSAISIKKDIATINFINYDGEDYFSIPIDIPKYIEKINLTNIKNGKIRVNDLLEEYLLTTTEIETIIKDISEKDYLKIEEEKVYKVSFDFDDTYLLIYFNNDEEENTIYTVKIYDKKFKRKLKRKLKKLGKL